MQTEDKGTDNPPSRPGYRGGEILAARRSYADLKATGWIETVIAGRIEQHNQVIADVRADGSSRIRRRNRHNRSFDGGARPLRSEMGPDRS